MIQAKINAVYGVKEMQKLPYHLHSICVHDGDASSGHCYSYIFDRCQKKWRKYNDITVTVVTEEEVWAFSEGKDNHSAYWLVYIQNPIAKELDK